MALDTTSLQDYFTPLMFGQDQSAFDARVARAVSAAEAKTDKEAAQLVWVKHLLYDQQLQVLRMTFNSIKVDFSTGSGMTTRSELSAQMRSTENARDAALAEFTALTDIPAVPVRGSRSVCVEVEF